MVNRLLSYEELIFAAQLKVRELFNLSNEKSLPFHNLPHTEQLVKKAVTIARAEMIDESDQAILVIAAWFSDTGFLQAPHTSREMAAAEIAGGFLKSREADPEFIAAVGNCILATSFPGKPQLRREMILCDATYSYFGEDDIKIKSKLLRKEDAVLSGKKMKKPEWRSLMIKQISQYKFFTTYAQNKYETEKNLNIALLKSKEEDDNENNDQEIIPATITPEFRQDEISTTVQTTEVRKKTTAREGPGRGVETMFRISSGNNQRLSDMADNKANIMITISSINFSVVLSMLLQRLGENTSLVIPTMVLLSVCVTTMVFAILATRPALPKGVFTQQDIDDKKVNLLFFGNYYKMNYETYQDGMNKMMKDNEFLYGSLTRDVYSQGIVLGKKYRLLRVAYNIFMFGIILSVLAFGVSVLSLL
jgi:hypothetical protein